MFRERSFTLPAGGARGPGSPGWMRNWKHETDPAAGPGLFPSGKLTDPSTEKIAKPLRVPMVRGDGYEKRWFT